VVALRAIGLGKFYKKYPKKIFRIVEKLCFVDKPLHSIDWVLRDVSFQVNEGEALGIVGLNGAGKSTLLKLVAGVISPSIGRYEVKGRVHALLELGMGFHQDFTGRQNIKMAGQLIGFSAKEISSCMDSIIEFSELENSIDDPVRTYSSGMQMRLAFSLATAVRPDVLIVDEALSVGDSYFQHKSFQKIRDFKNLGSTLLIVSHDKSAILSICDRVILIEDGKIRLDGKPEFVMDHYNASLTQNDEQELIELPMSDGRIGVVSGTGEVTTLDLGLFSAAGIRIETVDVGQTVYLQVKVLVEEPIDALVFGFSIKDRLGQTVFGTNTALTNQMVKNLKVGEVVSFKASFDANFGVGSHSVQTAFVSSETHLENNYEWKDLALIFEVVNITKNRFVGSSWVPVTFEIENG